MKSHFVRLFLGQTGLAVTSVVKLLINTGNSGIILVLSFNDLFWKLFDTKQRPLHLFSVLK